MNPVRLFFFSPSFWNMIIWMYTGIISSSISCSASDFTCCQVLHSAKPWDRPVLLAAREDVNPNQISPCVYSKAAGVPSEILVPRKQCAPHLGAVAVWGIWQCDEQEKDGVDGADASPWIIIWSLGQNGDQVFLYASYPGGQGLCVLGHRRAPCP